MSEPTAVYEYGSIAKTLVCYDDGADGGADAIGFFDSAGEYYHVLGEGPKVIRSTSEMLNYLNGMYEEKLTILYDVDKQEDLDRLEGYITSDEAMAVYRWFLAADCISSWKAEFMVRCDECDRVDSCDGAKETESDVVCTSCYDRGCCEKCNAYVGSESLLIFDGTEQMLCDECYSDEADEKVNERELAVEKIKEALESGSHLQVRDALPDFCPMTVSRVCRSVFEDDKKEVEHLFRKVCTWSFSEELKMSELGRKSMLFSDAYLLAMDIRAHIISENEALEKMRDGDLNA